jgi:hypothetical protein
MHWSAIILYICIVQSCAFSIKGVCSIFLRVDRSINEIFKPRVLFLIEVFYKKYVFIYY